MGAEVGAMALGAVLGSALGSRQKAPSIPAPQAAEPAPQASKTPDANSFLDRNMGTGQGGGSPGVSQTFLTGAGGVDPSGLNVRKNTLYGG